MPDGVRTLYLQARAELAKVMVGQEDLVELLVIALLCEGHVLVEGVPGTAKTWVARSLSRVLGCRFNRVQFTPDLMPSDVVGTSVFHLRDGEFRFREGPVFTNFLLGDEINRAPAKTQSSLLQAMEERQVTVDGTSYDLPGIFLVIATQNPIEQEGTYPLPEAQLDRFMFKLLSGYPGEDEEVRILATHHAGSGTRELDRFGLRTVADVAGIAAAREAIKAIHVEEPVLRYVARLVRATRGDPRMVRGASPRAGLQLLLASKGHAAIHGRDFVIPDDVKRVLLPTLRHRVELQPGAELEGITADEALVTAASGVEVPR
ncbi:MoxR family ATPase [Myxococcota bacterium]|nr:MoxR family ATPase [Myxococcota bacterium]